MGLRLPSAEALIEDGPDLQRANEALLTAVADRATTYVGYAAGYYAEPVSQYSEILRAPESEAWLGTADPGQPPALVPRQYYTAERLRSTDSWLVNLCLLDNTRQEYVDNARQEYGKLYGLKLYMSHSARLTVGPNALTIHELDSWWTEAGKRLPIEPELTMVGLTRATNVLRYMQNRAAKLPQPKSFFITA